MAELVPPQAWWPSSTSGQWGNCAPHPPSVTESEISFIRARAMTEQHPTYFLAATVAILAAVALRLAGVPAPWPPAIALYVYGLVAWPVLRHKMPTVRPLAYTAIWIGAALLVFVYEGLGAYAGK
jgi:hypothetical protein